MITQQYLQFNKFMSWLVIMPLSDKGLICSPCV